MQVKTKIFLTLCITLLLVFCSFIILDRINNTNNLSIYKIEKEIHKQTLNTITTLHSENLAKIVKDYGCYDQMIDFVKTHDTLWAKSDITIINSYEMDAVWVFNIKKENLYRDFSGIINSSPGISIEALNKLFEKKTIHYFVKIPEGFLEISGGSINSSEDTKRLNYAKGYLLIGKLWNENFIKKMSGQTNSILEIASDTIFTNLNSINDVISLPLLSYDNKEIATLFSHKNNLFLNNNRYFKTELYLFFGIFSVLILLIFYFSYNKYVIAPLKTVINSLKTEDDSSLDNLTKKTDEFGNIAETIIQFFKQKVQLENDIIERKIIETHLRESEKRFRDFAELLPGLVCEATIDGQLTFANRAAFEAFGWSADELKKLSVFSIFSPNDIERVKINIKRRIQGEDIGSNEYLALKKDGSTFPALVYVNIVYKENKAVSLRGVMVDITNIKNAEKEIRKLHHAIEQSPNTIVITDIHGNIEYVNPHFTILTGYKTEDVIGKNPRILKSGKMPETIYIQLWETIKAGNSWKGEFINKKKNGDIYWELANISPVKDNQGVIINYIAVKEDITERKRLEQILLDNNEEIKAQNDTLRTQKEEIEAQRDEIGIQRNIATAQRDEITQIHDEIKSSIRYAENIQKAMLPPKILLESLFEDYFVYYLPKDIVSGDFYWAKHIGNKTIVTVADCTGHGVPGAFMSLLGVSFLNEIVNKESVFLANEILNKLRKQVVQSLRQMGVSGSSKDGMDMSLVIIDDKDNSLQYAGANNPLFIIKKNEDLTINKLSNQIIELKPDKMPVGIHDNMDSFKNNEIQLQKGDCIYLFTDGINDQFGGPQFETGGKKFKLKQLQELLISNAHLPMHEQKTLIEKTFHAWRNNIEQTDDVTIMGIKI